MERISDSFGENVFSKAVMRERLPKMDADLSRRVDAVLQRNLQERHLRGGEATRRKYSALRTPDESAD